MVASFSVFPEANPVVVFLKKQLVAVQEEISELKMLVNLYERQTVLKNTASGCNQPENNIQ